MVLLRRGCLDTCGKAGLDSLLSVSQNFELRKWNIWGNLNGVESIVPLVTDITHRVADWKIFMIWKIFVLNNYILNEDVAISMPHHKETSALLFFVLLFQYHNVFGLKIKLCLQIKDINIENHIACVTRFIRIWIIDKNEKFCNSTYDESLSH